MRFRRPVRHDEHQEASVETTVDERLKAGGLGSDWAQLQYSIGAAQPAIFCRRIVVQDCVGLLSALTLCLGGCAPSAKDLGALAARGAIQEDAPVKAEAQIVIQAPQARVWAILADIQHWPQWQTDISHVTIAHSPAAGVTFSWSLGNNDITSRIVVFEPIRAISWTGRLFTSRAIHLWALTTLPDGRTRIQTRESISGWPISMFYSSAELLDSNRQWLARLKTAAEDARSAPIGTPSPNVGAFGDAGNASPSRNVQTTPWTL